jgi:hypothetical protein
MEEYECRGEMLHNALQKKERSEYDRYVCVCVLVCVFLLPYHPITLSHIYAYLLIYVCVSPCRRTTERMRSQQLAEYKTTIAQLRGKIMDLESTNSALDDSVRQMKSKSPAKDAMARRLKAENRQLQHQLTVDQDDMRVLNGKLAQLEQENRSLNAASRTSKERTQTHRQERASKQHTLERTLHKTR